MTTIRVHYHREMEGWWADSPDLQGFVATGEELGEVRDLVKSGLPFYTTGPVEIAEEFADYEWPVVDLRLDEDWLHVSLGSVATPCGRVEYVHTSGPRLYHGYGTDNQASRDAARSRAEVAIQACE